MVRQMEWKNWYGWQVVQALEEVAAHEKVSFRDLYNKEVSIRVLQTDPGRMATKYDINS